MESIAKEPSDVAALDVLDDAGSVSAPGIHGNRAERGSAAAIWLYASTFTGVGHSGSCQHVHAEII